MRRLRLADVRASFAAVRGQRALVHMPSAEPSSIAAPSDRPSGTVAADARSGETLHAELALAAHDVNNALNSVLVGSHLLQLSAGDAEAVRRHADRITQAARQGVAAAARTTALLRAATVANAAVGAPHSHVSETAP
jgi:hypothetical protein